MINIMIKNLKGDYYEYVCKDESDINSVLIQYINNVLDGFDSKAFPITEAFWDNKIKWAVDQIDDITITEKINLLNGICRRPVLNIVKVFTGYSINYPLTKLSTPVLSITPDGGIPGRYLITWDAVDNATSYYYTINGDEELPKGTDEHLAILDELSDGDEVRVKAVGDGIEYCDSDYAEITYTVPATT